MALTISKFDIKLVHDEDLGLFLLVMDLAVLLNPAWSLIACMFRQ
jgi:hypothetical protein